MCAEPTNDVRSDMRDPLPDTHTNTHTETDEEDGQLDRVTHASHSGGTQKEEDTHRAHKKNKSN